MVHRTTSHIWLLGIALLSLVVCAETESANPNFPKLRDPPNTYMDALLVGELVSENGCLRVRNLEHGSDHLLIWSYASEMTDDGQGVLIGDDSEVTLSVGEQVRIGGGESSLFHIQTLVAQPIPRKCLGGSYWLVGEVSTSSQ